MTLCVIPLVGCGRFIRKLILPFKTSSTMQKEELFFNTFPPFPQKQRHELCVNLLDTIKNSVNTFKPSTSLAVLSELSSHHHGSYEHHYDRNNEQQMVYPREPKAEIDIVISGGGLKGYFMTGCSHILQHELRKQNIRIARVSGASAGAWAGLFMLTDFGTHNWLETYYLCQARPHLTMHEAYTEIWPWVNSHLPENAWQICSGRLFISITEVTWYGGLHNHLISEFTSNFDLFEACLASSTVPFISLPTMFRKYRDMYVVDGGITNNVPVFTDYAHRQLVFRLGDVSYPWHSLVTPRDQVIEALVVRGAIQMSRFLQGEPSDAFAWVYTAEDHLPTSSSTSSKKRKSSTKLTNQSETSSNNKYWSMMMVGLVTIAGYGLLQSYDHLPTIWTTMQQTLVEVINTVPVALPQETK